MKCPNCGAEVTTRFCEYCGSEQPRQEPSVTIINNYYTDAPQSTPTAPVTPAPKPKRKTFLWILGWIFIFPVPLTILLVRNKAMKLWLRLLLIGIAWALYLIIAITGGSEDAAMALLRFPF